MRVQRLEAAFMNAQHSMPQDPHNVAYASQECELATALQQAQIDHTSLLQQRAKMSWLRFGDDNTSFFHRSIKQRRIQNRVKFLCVNNSFITNPNIIHRTFRELYSALVCCKMENYRKVNLPIIRDGYVLNQTQRDMLIVLYCSGN